jgi:cyclic-di-GMP phosphodiesterase TipF (flagellum assembly factor)
MLRVTELFVAIGMLLIAGALGSVSVLALGLPRTEGAVVALAAFAVLVLYYLAVSRARDRRDQAGQLVDLSRGIADLARQVGQQEQRLAALASSTETAIQNLSAINQPLAAEVAELGAMVRQLTGAIGGAEDVIASSPAFPAWPAAAAAAGGPDNAMPSEGNTALIALIRQAIQSGGVGFSGSRGKRGIDRRSRLVDGVSVRARCAAAQLRPREHRDLLQSGAADVE